MSEITNILAYEQTVLAQVLGLSAEFRRSRARKMPDDIRHAHAATVADRLMAGVEAFEFDSHLFARFAGAHRAEQARGVDVTTMSATVRTIGFGFEPKTVDDLLRAALFRMRRSLN